MYQQIKHQINQIISLTDTEFEQFLAFTEIRKLKKKELILREGEICRAAWFINYGSLRYFYLVNGEEHTGQFFFENSWFTDFNSFLSSQPSKLYVEALEKTEIILISRASIEKLHTQIPKFERFSRLMAENAFKGLRNKTEMLANQSPEERYLNLVKERPKLIQRVAQRYIASYLGIKPQSLSRIRRRIFDNS
jgi:CRP/FNR family transcriptional regulator, anaerobic regulatory protein